MKYTQKN